MIKYVYIIFVLLISSCSKAAIHKAEYLASRDNFSIVIELTNAHPFLAEYKSELVLLKQGKEISRKQLFFDTGGYSDFNLYLCGSDMYALVGYFGSMIVDSALPSISQGQCDKDELEYIGVFSWGKKKNWKFYSEEELPEKSILPMKGG